MVRCSLLPLTVILVVLAGGSVASVQTPQTVIDRFIQDQMLENVVIITAESSGTTILGLGFVIGRSGRLIWVATAAHVVFPEYEAGQSERRLVPATAIRAVRRNDSRSWPAAAAPDKGFEGDYAFVSFEMPFEEAGLDRWRERVALFAPTVGDTVVIAGQPREIIYGKPGGQVVGQNAEGAAVVEGLVGVPGQSGGPLATSRGFIGMYVQSAGQRFIPLSVIQEGARLAGRPWQLLEVEPPPSPVRLCLVTQGRTENLRVMGPLGPRAADSSGCLDTVSGQHRITLNTAWTVCSPDMVTLGREQLQRVDVKCSVDPAGVWVSPSSGSIEVAETGPATWSFFWQSGSPFGWVSGRLTGTAPNLTLEGRSQFGYRATGSLLVEPARLSGRLQLGLTVYDIEVRR